MGVRPHSLLPLFPVRYNLRECDVTADERAASDGNSLATHLGNWIVRLVDRVTQWVYSATDGRVGHKQLGWSVLLLTTLGRKTDRSRVHTLVYLKHGEELVVAGSNNGADTYPAWYLNLDANPHVHVQVGRQKGEYLAWTASPEERLALWPKLIAYHPPYAHHQERTQREIPVVILTPVAR